MDEKSEKFNLEHRDEVDFCRLSFKEEKEEIGHMSHEDVGRKIIDKMAELGTKATFKSDTRENNNVDNHFKCSPNKSDRFSIFSFTKSDILRSKSMDALLTNKSKMGELFGHRCMRMKSADKLEVKSSKMADSEDKEIVKLKTADKCENKTNTFIKNRKSSTDKVVKTKEIPESADDYSNRSPSDLLTRSEAFGSSADLSSGKSRRAMRAISRGLGRLLRRHSSSLDISAPDPEYKVSYLGNVLTGWAKGDGCVEKPLATLWRNFTQSSKPNVAMCVSVATSGLKATTKQHGLTEYWAHRVTHCCAPKNYPKIFCWVYRHEGRKLKHEMRCHAVLCSKESVAAAIAQHLQDNLAIALADFKRDKISRQNARLSLVNSVYDNPSLPRRKILLSVGGNNYRPPLERSKSAPKLMAIEEIVEEEEETHELLPQLRCCQNSDIFPSYTLGRRRCPRGHSIKRHRSRKCLQPNASTSSEETTCNGRYERHEETEQQSSENFNELSSNETLTNDENQSIVPVFSLTESDKCNGNDSDFNDDVFFDQDNVITILSFNGGKPNGSIPIGLNLDSDEGSISSGCETASTVTASDVETQSCNVFDKVQCYERLSMPECMASPQLNRSSESDVMLEPLGEHGGVLEYRRSFRRSFTCPRNLSLDSSQTFELNVEVDVSIDSDGEFSDESGYAELLESKCRTIVLNKSAVIV